MIVAMKKVAVIMESKDAPSAIKALALQGLLHVEHAQPPKGKDLSLLRDDAALLNQGLEILSETKNLASLRVLSEQKLPVDWKATVLRIIDLQKRIDRLSEYSKELSKRIYDWQLWGDFDPEIIRELSGKGIYVKLFAVPLKEVKNIPASVTVEKVTVKNGFVYCALISREKIEAPFKEIELPKMSLGKMKERLSEDMRVAFGLKEEIRRGLCYRQGLLESKNKLDKEIEFLEVLSGSGESSGLTFLSGYAPADAEQALIRLAKKEKWGILISDLAEEDNPPTLIRNPKWVNLITPVYKLMEVVPGYRELDVSPIFLLFLSLFFGMIIGDAGYGAVYFTLTFLAKRKLAGKVKDKTVFFLFYLFSSCAMMWGLLSGTVFGQQWYVAKGFKALAPALNDTKFLMAFCFLLGAVQLSLAHGWQALKKIPSLTALADIGFICLIWLGFLLSKMFILGDAFPIIGKWLAWAGVTLIIFFVNPQKNFFKSIGAGLGTLALNAIGNFGDIVSYIRLFAVGLAGVAVADSVNTLAATAAGNIIAQTLILFIGHSINIILGPMSVLVHGIRLNVLEFSLLHGNVTWSGVAYKPLKE
ncbi:MAG: hypothetical protein AABY28_00460 [Candidatus Omnitrophota bacterium]